MSYVSPRKTNVEVSFVGPRLQRWHKVIYALIDGRNSVNNGREAIREDDGA